MEFDELSTLWKEADRRLAALELPLRASLWTAREGMLDRMRSKLRFVHLVLWYEAGFGVLAALLAGSYLFDNLGTIRFALPALLLHVAAILTLASAVRQLVALGQVDPAGPVVEMQKRLAELGLSRARANRWLILSAPLLWAVLVVVVPHGLAGLDVYRAFGPAWVAGNFAVGIACLAGAAWVSRRSAAGSRASAFLRWLGEDLAGRKVAIASGFLDEVAAFETEGQTK